MAKTTSTLLKQAIADAEAVRETAVANAKLVLEEAITPQIREMIARRLRVEAMEDEAAKHEAAKEQPFQDGEPVGGSESPQDTSAIGGTDNKEPSPDAEDTSDIGHGPEAQTDSHTDWYDDWSDSDFDLDEVIKELEEDINALQGNSLAEESDEEEEAEGEEEEGEEEKAPAHPMKKEGWKEEENADPAKFANPQAGLTPEASDEEEGEEDTEELDLEAILAELEADDEEEKMQHGTPHAADSEKHAMAAKLADLKRELAQYKEAVSHLSGRLQEVNILNAKLLYTNKMFRNQGLTNEQKVRIVESFDRATTVREVKLVYAALVENLSTAAKTFNASRKKVVAEGLASKATPSTAPKNTVIVENAVAKRLQELAGII